MRIVQLIPDFDLGGIQKAGVVLGKFFHRNNHQVLVVGKRKGPRCEELTASGVSWKCYDDTKSLKYVLESFRPDVIHVHAAGFDSETVDEAANLGGCIPIVVTPVFGRPPSDLKVLCRVVTCCVGLYTHARLCRWLKLPVEEAIKRGVVFAELTPFEPPDEPGISPALQLNTGACVIFGRIGRSDPLKWHPRTAEMVSKILMAVPNSVWLSIGWPECMQLREMQSKWQGRFLNFSATADYRFIHKCYESLDLHFFASRYGECFSSTICESACAGTPTIAIVHPFNDAGEIEQIIDGVTGWLTYSPGDLVRQSITHLRRPKLLQEMRVSVRAFAMANWHIEIVGPQVLAIYEGLCTGRVSELAQLPSISRAVRFDALYSTECRRAMESMSPIGLGNVAYYLYHNYAIRRFVTRAISLFR